MALKIDDEIVKTSMTEVMMQNIADFASMTNGGISLTTEYFMGDAIDMSKIAEIANLVGGRDPLSDAAATVKAVSSVDEHNIAIYFTTGSVEFKNVEARRYGSDSEAFSRAIGTQIAVGFLNYAVNRGILAASAAMQSEATIITGDGTAAITYPLLNTALGTFGDASGSIVAWVMKGVTYHEVAGDGITNQVTDNVAGSIVNMGTVPALGRPVFVTDSLGLTMKDIATGLVDTNAVLGLTVGGIAIIERMARDIVTDTVGGSANIKTTIQAEGEAALDIKGYTFSGADAPDDATLGAAANWALAASDVKSSAGVLINVT